MRRLVVRDPLRNQALISDAGRMKLGKIRAARRVILSEAKNL